MQINKYIQKKFRDSKGIAFFDIDGTLLPYGATMPLISTHKAIQILSSNGYEIFISTGKSYYEASKVGSQLGIRNYITSNGNVIHLDNKLVHKKEIPIDLIVELLINTKNDKVTIGMHGNKDSTIIDGKSNESLINFLKEISIEIPAIEDYYFPKFSVTQLWISGQYEKQNIPKELSVIPWKTLGGDVNFNTSSKGATIKENFTWHRNTIAFGDGNNDIEMFNVVKVSIAMGNASSEVKSYATYTTDECNKDGIYKFVKKFLNTN